MNEKVLLILIDGMRPDAVMKSENPFLSSLLPKSTYAMDARTVFPPVTLPCHASLFLSVDPGIHGITGNTWKSPVRPLEGLADVVSKAGGNAAFFYNWEPLRDLARPGSLKCSYYQDNHSFADSDCRVTDKAAEYIREAFPDFVFLYLGQTDECGHKYGWMSQEYMEALAQAISCVEKVLSYFQEKYTVIITADHGGHDRNHGMNIREDMTIPIILYGKCVEQGKRLAQANIMDIAPTAASLMGIPKPAEWDGHCLPVLRRTASSVH